MDMVFANTCVHCLPDDVSAFDTLPDEALVNLKVIIVLSCRSKSSIYRDIAANRLTRPIHIGSKSARWRVGDVREYLTGKYI